MNNKHPTNDASTSKEKTKIEVFMEDLCQVVCQGYNFEKFCLQII